MTKIKIADWTFPIELRARSRTAQANSEIETSKSQIRYLLMHHLLEVWSGWVLHWGYFGIILLMAMESSIFPVPSEIVIPPAAFLAARGDLSMSGVIIAGTVGS